MKKILVTGGTGFLGSSLVRKLVQLGHDVTVIDNDYRGRKNRLSDIKGNFEFINGDIRDKNKVIKACENKDNIIHLAYINGTEFFYSKPELVLEVGVKGMMNVLDGCLKHSVPELFLASSSEVYNEPTVIPTPEDVPLIVPDAKNPRFSYSGGKIISELLALNYGRKYFKRVVIFRPHNVYGPDMGNEHVIPQFSRMMNELQEKYGNSFVFPIQGDGSETRSFIYIDDFIKGLLLLLKKGKHMETYNIGSRDEVTIEKLAYLMGEVVGSSITLKKSKRLPGSVLRRCGDNAKITALGFKQSVALEEGLRKTITWYKNN